MKIFNLGFVLSVVTAVVGFALNSESLSIIGCVESSVFFCAREIFAEIKGNKKAA